MYDRGSLKRQAKQLIRSGKPHFMLAALVCWLLTAGLSTAANWLTAGADSYLTGGMLGLFLVIVVTLFGIVMGTGFLNYALRLSRGEPAGWNSLFQPFSYAGRTLGTRLLTALFMFLWAMILIPAIGFLAVILSIIPVMTVGAIIVLLTLYYLLVLAMFLAFYLWILRYWMAAFSLVDDPETGAMEHIRRSIRMTRGYQGKLFVLNLSFLGWTLLVGLLTLLVVTVAALVISSQGGFDWIPHAWDVLLHDPNPTLVSAFSTRLANQMAPWVLLGQVLSLPLSLWLMAYAQTSLALFYNYVGGYDYYQYMLAHPPQGDPTPQGPASRPVQPDPGSASPMRPAPPAGGYYTPQPYVPDRPEEPPQSWTPPAPSPEPPVPQPGVPALPENPSQSVPDGVGSAPPLEAPSGEPEESDEEEDS